MLDRNNLENNWPSRRMGSSEAPRQSFAAATQSPGARRDGCGHAKAGLWPCLRPRLGHAHGRVPLRRAVRCSKPLPVPARSGLLRVRPQAPPCNAIRSRSCVAARLGPVCREMLRGAWHSVTAKAPSLRHHSPGPAQRPSCCPRARFSEVNVESWSQASRASEFGLVSDGSSAGLLEQSSIFCQLTGAKIDFLPTF